MYQLNGFRKSIPPQNCQPILYHYELKQYVDGFVGVLTFSDHLIDTMRQSHLGPVDPSFRAISGRLKFTVRRLKIDKDSFFL